MEPFWPAAAGAAITRQVIGPIRYRPEKRVTSKQFHFITFCHGPAMQSHYSDVPFS
jgi:hypothetical protein